MPTAGLLAANAHAGPGADVITVRGKGHARNRVGMADQRTSYLSGGGVPDLERLIITPAHGADGQWIVSGSWDETLKVWDAATGQEVRTMRGHAGRIRSVALSADGKRMVSGSDDRTLEGWDTASAQEIYTLTGHTKVVSSVALSVDGKRIVSASEDNTLKIWDAATGKEWHTLTGHVGAVTSVAWSSDGRRILSGSDDGTVKIWDASPPEPGGASARP